MDRDLLFPARLSVEAVSSEQQDLLEQQVREGEIVLTPGRRRPLYFDGRFLTAADLTADQNYVRQRLADMGRALGFGAIAGLHVTLNDARNGVEISAGHGITPSGELVMLAPPGPYAVLFAHLEEQQQVQIQLGLRGRPQPSTTTQATRDGLYVLALRPVEFSADPVASYPTTLDGARSVRDGSTVEAVAITLVPYVERTAANATPQQRRAQVAREVFHERSRSLALQDALPLAVVLFSQGTAVWLDEPLARREVGTESGLAVMLAPRPRALLEAWLAQYRAQLAEAVRTGLSAATQVFSVLPPVGTLPATAIDWEGGFDAGLRQSFFPPSADIEFSFIAEDELPALVDEGLALPPIDLTAGEDALDHLSLLVLAPVPRATLEDVRRNLDSARRPVRLATPTRTAARTPLAALTQLGGLSAPLLVRPVAPPSVPVFSPGLALLPPRETLDAAWQRAFETALAWAGARHGGMFWYLRRRQLPLSAEVGGTTMRLSGTAAQLDAELALRLKVDAAQDDFAAATGKSALLTSAELLNTLASPRLALGPTVGEGRLAVSDLLRRAALVEVTAAGKAGNGAVPHEEAVRIGQSFTSDRLGEGWQRLLAAQPELQDATVARVITESRVVPELDRMAADQPDDGVAGLGAQLLELARGSQVAAIQALVK